MTTKATKTKAKAKAKVETCLWRHDAVGWWDAGCGEDMHLGYELETREIGHPRIIGMKFCPFCAKKIRIGHYN